ncbi:MAG: oxygenase MpaB family protein [Pseudomonadota bacterium]
MLSPVRRALVRQVRSTFNDQAKGERPIPRSQNALFPPDSVIWRVHGDVTSMMAAGIAALLLQMLHPQALAGVWDHSNVHDDMLGRLRRTARFIAITTYGERGTAEAAIAKVRRIHEQVGGSMPDGRPYRADDPRLLAWVHVAGAMMFLEGWLRYGEPGMSRADQNRYFAESGLVARMLGADPVPDTRAAAERLIGGFRGELVANDRSREFRDLVINAEPGSLAQAAVHKLLMSAATDLLPPWARNMHGLTVLPFTGPPVRAATFGLASTLRWAFAREAYR